MNDRFYPTPEAAVASAEYIARLARRHADAAFEAQGMRAFELPKSAAASHEAGHAVYQRAAGIPVSSVHIFRTTKQGGGWIGRTDGNKAWLSTPSTPPETDLAHARMLVAGCVSEVLIEGPDFRFGSSPDEMAKASGLCAMAARKLGADDHKVLLAMQMALVHRVLMARRAPLDRIRGELLRRKSLRGRLLRKLLSGVAPAPPGYFASAMRSDGFPSLASCEEKTEPHRLARKEPIDGQ